MAISEVIRAVSSKTLGGPWEREPLGSGGAHEAIGTVRKQALLVL